MSATVGSASRGVILTVGANLGLAALGMATGVIAARLLGPEARGELAAIQMWGGVLQLFAALGLTDALVYFCAKDPASSGGYFGSALVLALISSLAFVAAGLALMPALLSAQSMEVISAARWYLLLVPLGVLIGIPGTLLQGRGDFAAWNLLRFLMPALWLAILIVALSRGNSNPRSIALGYIAAVAATAPVAAYLVSRRVAAKLRFRPGTSRSLLAYGLPSMASSIPQVLASRLDQLLIAALLPTLTLGFYVVAVAWSGILGPFLTAFAAVIFPKIASEPGAERRADLLASGCRMTVAIALTVTLLGMLCTPWVLPMFFGASFRAAVPAAQLLLAAGGISGFNVVIQHGIRGLGKPGAVVWSEMGGLAVTSVSLALLLRPFDMMGAATGSLLGCTTATIISILQIKRLTGRAGRTFLRPTTQDLRTGLAGIRSLLTNVSG